MYITHFNYLFIFFHYTLLECRQILNLCQFGFLSGCQEHCVKKDNRASVSSDYLDSNFGFGSNYLCDLGFLI